MTGDSEDGPSLPRSPLVPREGSANLLVAILIGLAMSAGRAEGPGSSIKDVVFEES